MRRLLPVRRRRVAQEEPDPRRLSELGRLQRVGREEPRDPAPDPGEARRRDSRRPRVPRRGSSRTSTRAAWTSPRSKRPGSRRSQGELDRIAAIADRASLQEEIARLQERGVNALFQFGSEEDRKNSSQVIAAALQGGLGLPDRDYYTKTDDESKELRAKYVAHVAKMLELAGDAPATAAEEAKTILDFETKLAVPAMTRVERRNPDNTYHPYRGEELARLTPRFSWTAYLRGEGVPEGITVNVWQPKFFEAVNGLLDSEPLPVWKTYLRWQLVHAAAPSLSKKFVDEDFDFNQKTLQGTEENLPRWKRCVAATDQALGMALGKIYVRDHFPPQAKERADRMVKNLVAALRDDLADVCPGWARRRARRRSRSSTPSRRRSVIPTSGATTRRSRSPAAPTSATSSPASVFDFRRDLAKVGKPVDRTDWEHDAADGQRVLQARPKRDRLSRRDPPAPVLRRGRGRRGQLRRHRRGHRPRDDARLRRRRAQVRRAGEPARTGGRRRT